MKKHELLQKKRSLRSLRKEAKKFVRAGEAVINVQKIVAFDFGRSAEEGFELAKQKLERDAYNKGYCIIPSSYTRFSRPELMANCLSVMGVYLGKGRSRSRGNQLNLQIPEVGIGYTIRLR